MRVLLTLVVVAVYLLHQDVWFWRTAYPVVFGMLPVGLFYHACYVIGASALMWLLVATSWPSHLDANVEPADSAGTSEGE